jgi:hypothetical protein
MEIYQLLIEKIESIWLTVLCLNKHKMLKNKIFFLAKHVSGRRKVFQSSSANSSNVLSRSEGATPQAKVGTTSMLDYSYESQQNKSS